MTRSLHQRARRGECLADLGIVDAHGHLGPYSGFEVPDSGPEGMIDVMDRVGVAQVAVSPHAAIEGDYRRGNDLIARVKRRWPDRFIGYLTINPTFPHEVQRELRRGRRRLKLDAIKLHPGLSQYPIDGPNYAPVWPFAAEHGIPVLSHTWDGCSFCNLAKCRDVAVTHPDMTLILGHSGGSVPGFEKAIEVARECPSVLLGTACSNCRYGVIEHLVEAVGADRIVFGSDVPFLSLPAQLGKVVHARVSDADKRKILRGNFLRALGRETV